MTNFSIAFPTTRCISIGINDDSTFESNELFSVVVSSSDAPVRLPDDEVTVIIESDEGKSHSSCMHIITYGST